MLSGKLSNKELIILFSSFAITLLLGVLKTAVSFPSWINLIFIPIVLVYTCVQLYIILRLFLYMRKNSLNLIYGIIGYIFGMSIYYLSRNTSGRPIEESMTLLSLEGGMVILSLIMLIVSTIVIISGLFKLAFKK